MAIKVLVVDDEAPAREEIVFLLQNIPDVEVAAQASSGTEALKLFLVHEPKIVFLDIQMPKIDGFAVARSILDLPGKKPAIIFTTAFEQYAVRAFEVCAIDYLMKPIAEKRLVEAVLRAKSRLDHEENLDRKLDALTSQLERSGKIQKVPVEKTGRTLLLDPSDISYATCVDKEVYVHTTSGEYLTRLTLQELEARLGSPFFRVHKGFIVNLEWVAEVIPWFQSSYYLVLRDPQGSKIPVGRHKVKEVRNLLGI